MTLVRWVASRRTLGRSSNRCGRPSGVVAGAGFVHSRCPLLKDKHCYWLRQIVDKDNAIGVAPDCAELSSRIGCGQIGIRIGLDGRTTAIDVKGTARPGRSGRAIGGYAKASCLDARHRELEGGTDTECGFGLV